MNNNSDQKTVESFGDEWHRFDQSDLDRQDAENGFKEYFSLFPWQRLPANATGFDMGCGSGRWAKFVAPRVGHLHCIDPSSAIEVAKRLMNSQSNVSFHNVGVSDHPLPLNSQDFGYSLGVLHHVPDTAAGISACVDMLKPGAPLLLYLYYAFDNRPLWFRALWSMSDIVRKSIHRLPATLKRFATDVIACVVYFPLARFSRLLELLGMNVESFPLSFYRSRSFFTMRTDSRDRFGTPLEQRFSKDAIRTMMTKAGLSDIEFANHMPYWCAIGFKRSL